MFTKLNLILPVIAVSIFVAVVIFVIMLTVGALTVIHKSQYLGVSKLQLFHHICHRTVIGLIVTDH